LKFKPYLAVATVGVGLLVSAGPAFALAGDQAIDDSSPFRLNPYTLEPGCSSWGNRSVELDDHIDLTALVDGDLVEELHVSVDDDAAFSVDQVLVAGKYAGYRIYNTFDTGTSGTDPDVDPNQTAVDLFGPDGSHFVSTDDTIVCVSDHNDNVSNEPYLQEADGMVAAKNRPIIQPIISCLGVSAIEPLNTYKIGFGYEIERSYVPDRFTALFGITDPNAKDTDGDYWPDEVRLNPREDRDYDARRVNDFDQFNEEFVGDIDDYGQTRKFSLDGDPYAWSESNRNDPDTFGSLVTFTAQGDLPLTWTLRASLASSASERSVTLTLADLTAWENGTGMDVPLCPGTNGPEITPPPAPPAPPAAPAAPAAPTSTTTIIEKTTVQTVAGETVVKKAAKKGGKKSAKKAKKSCMKKAKAKKSAKAKKKAMRKCRRM
jgi:hypothetical protein